jgi:predicted ATPase
MTDDFKPEGDHIPLTLAHLPIEATNSKAQRVWNAVKQFGADSGLFSELNVKLLGPRPSDPFQIRVRTVGPRVNLADVGYGVSQSLPILMESVLAARGRTLLIQQPEVHLHPRAQAALGTLFTRLAHEDGKNFIIETHSDYLVDRIRMEVSAGKIPHDNVQILFFERSGIDSKIHVLGIDPLGNITNAPPTFRSFFLKEELKLLTRGD